MIAQQVKKFVITGGPGGGKSTLLEYLSNKLSGFGYSVIVVPEMATDLINLQRGPAQLGIEEFQRVLLKELIARENAAFEAAQGMPGNVVIIFDRGTLDARAYVSSENFNMLLEEHETTLVDLRDQRYDAVIFLHSTAHDAPHIYQAIRRNNPARSETVAQARALNELTLKAWINHAHLRVINNLVDMEEKKLRVLKEVCHVLGIPQPLEIERKWLVTEPISLDEVPQPYGVVEISQQYLECDDSIVERIRARREGLGCAHFHTVKWDVSPGKRIEHEELISLERYEELMKRARTDISVICKQRYNFVYKDQFFELDVFQGHRKGLIMLELELTDDPHHIELPEFLQGKLLDVTNDRSFTNRALAELVK